MDQNKKSIVLVVGFLLPVLLVCFIFVTHLYKANHSETDVKLIYDVVVIKNDDTKYYLSRNDQKIVVNEHATYSYVNEPEDLDVAIIDSNTGTVRIIPFNETKDLTVYASYPGEDYNVQLVRREVPYNRSIIGTLLGDRQYQMNTNLALFKGSVSLRNYKDTDPYFTVIGWVKK